MALEEILIIGGVAAGLSAASRARRLSPSAHITVLEKGPVAGYGACGLPYFLSGRIASLDRLLAHPPEFFRKQRNIDLRVNHEALAIEPGRRRVAVRAEGKAEQWFGYDRLVIATGARSHWTPPGLRNVFAANTWAQVEALDRALTGENLRRVTVVGGGYIGLEVAEALRLRGLEVTLIDRRGTLLHGLEEGLAAALPGLVRAAGITLHQGVNAEGLEGAAGGRVLGVRTAKGVIEADAVINCAGLRPEVALAQAAGVTLGRFGGIEVDDRQQTNLAGIFAAGDCAETRDRVTGRAIWVPLGAAANKQGRVAGQNAAGGAAARFAGVLGTLAVPLFGEEWGRTGLSLEQARAAGYDAATETVAGESQAGYLAPRPITVTLVYQPSTARLLGCHLRGAPGTVAGRLGVAAVALAAGMKLEELEQQDLPYAPGLAPLYDPLLIAAHNARSH
ncbi:MAG TPA: FAD-dependent oxidoreductase [Terriglobales bacterium]|nr:FAD-dependent oxidoreductase [Terriglobales bacterium]